MTRKIICLLLACALTLPLLGAAAETTKLPAPNSFNAANGMARQIDVSYKTVKGAAGYQIAISTSGKFPKSKTSAMIHKGSKTGLTSKKLKNVTGDTIKKCNGKALKAGKTYYVRARAYELNEAENKVFGKWAKTQKVTADSKNRWPKTKTIRYLGKTWTYERIDPYSIPDGFGGKTQIKGWCSYHVNNETGKHTKDCLGQHYGPIFCGIEIGREKEALKNICSNCHRPGCAKRITCKNCDRCHGGAIGGWENCYKDKIRNW